MLYRLKQKRCNKCKYHYKTDILDCCDRPDKNGLKLLRPMRLICFKYKK